MSDYICSLLTQSINQTSLGILYLINNLYSLINLSASQQHFDIPVTTTTEQSSHNETNKHECYIKAMNYELDASKLNKACIFVDP